MARINDPPQILENRLVLVVEDEAMIALLVESSLSEAGARVLVAAGVDAALQLVETHQPDAAVLDCLLDGMPVTPVSARLAELAVPVVFMSGNDEHCDTDMHPQAPVSAKPFDTQDLAPAINDLLR